MRDIAAEPMPIMNPSPRFAWLHLSDLHFRKADSERPSDKQWFALRSDLELLHQEIGPVHAVFVTGDLTHTASPEEFQKCFEWLDLFMKHLKTLGSDPILCTVPGNHDVQWVGLKGSFEARVLQFLSESGGLRKEFWRSRSPLRQVIQNAFDAYEYWPRQSIGRSFRKRRGTLPGDFSTTVKIDRYRLGIVGLNTAYTQLAGDGKPAIDARQLKHLCREGIDQWDRDHDLNILLTHHDPSSLDTQSRTDLYESIAPPGRFALHLCGSLHSDRSSSAVQDSSTLIVQAPPAISDASAGYIFGSVLLDRPTLESEIYVRRYDIRSQAYQSDSSVDSGQLLAYHRRYQLERNSRTSVSQVVSDKSPTFRVQMLEIENFRAFSRLKLAFTADSQLPGRWTCLAGINGAGKSSVLQAISLALLGDPLMRELGGDRLDRTRRTRSASSETWIRLHALVEDANHYVDLPITQTDGTKEDVSIQPLRFWQEMRKRVVVGFGATRNLSDAKDTRNSHVSPDVRRVISLFDPLAQLASAELLLIDQEPEAPVLRIFETLIKSVFGDELGFKVLNNRAKFVMGTDIVEAVDLPDGFRSSASWMFELCSVWCEKFPTRAVQGSVADIEAVVLIDEVDLHLHPSLQRSLVPNLRKALPKVQWFVSTHSPLILSNFDSNEIIALDRSQPGGVRFLDRQIMGFSTDQVYEWLMGTEPTSAELERQLTGWNKSKRGSDTALATLLQTSPIVGTSEAQSQVMRLGERLAKLGL